MQRRKALATAGAISVTALAATIALGANLGLFGLTDDHGGPGNFAPVGAARHGPVGTTEVADLGSPVRDAVPTTGQDRGARDESREGHEPAGHEDD
jgi:hypothetical protein